MARLLDTMSDIIWRALESETNCMDHLNLWDSEWENQWTSAWNYDEIHMLLDPRTRMWVWTDGNKGNTLV